MQQRSAWQIQRAVVFALVMRELKTRLGGRWMGVVWLVGEPLAAMTVMLWLRTDIRDRTERAGYDMVIYTMVSLLPFLMFRNLWTQISRAITSNSALFIYKQVKPLDTAWARTIVELIIKFLVYGIAFMVASRLDYGPVWPRDTLGYLTVILLFTILGFSIGLISCVVVHFVPRLSVLISLTQMPLYLLSGALFRVDNLPPTVVQVLMWNPLLHLTELSRLFFLSGYPIMRGIEFAYPVKFTVVLTFLAVCTYWVNRQELAGRS
ncbi:ABC transporter permease [Ideonella livida]|uniref:ABC transporter permease n=1 Tax=Ideonella livida TaxID=2707176 RepID=A0A7C9THW2_9BURK|nr:ABC transporter permease [Ideonella livida]NDY90899.1 ABC transporter permease [Ideonella livida]